MYKKMSKNPIIKLFLDQELKYKDNTLAPKISLEEAIQKIKYLPKANNPKIAGIVKIATWLNT